MKHSRDRTPREPADARQTVNEKVESLTDAQYWDRTWAGRPTRRRPPVGRKTAALIS
jgi:hypothetical protein